MMSFLDMLFPPRADEVALRSVSLDGFLALVSPQVVPATNPESAALLPFHNELVRAAIHEAKYHGNERAFKYLGIALAEYLRDADDVRKPILVPVPLGRKRRAERGFNQVEEIAERAGVELDIPMDATLLRRVRETESQISLAKESRKENMLGAFRATRYADSTRTYILLDDVITTGATLQAAVNALQAAGAKHLIPLALAH